jgi:spermidine/putrescine ABC transporter ATP-binding subunit
MPLAVAQQPDVTATNRASQPQVELIGVARQFGPVRAVSDVTLAINRGEFFSLLGPSGCGKTTTLRMIGGFELPTRGQVRIGGVDVTNVPANRRPTNMVFQQLALFPHLTVFENVAFGLRLRRQPRDEIHRRVRDALALVNLQGFDERPATQLSGGQQQRVALARALVNEPAVLLLDEPLAALDLKLRTQMQTELKALQQRLGMTFIFVTHDKTEAFAMSDRIALMNAGRIEQIGPPRELYERPASRFTALFMGDTNLIEGRVTPDGNGLAIDGADITIAAPLDRLQPGTPVALSLRPEHLEIRDPASGRLAGTVTSAVFQGPLIKVGIEAGALRLQALVVNTRMAAGIAPGATVGLSWTDDHLAVLRP